MTAPAPAASNWSAVEDALSAYVVAATGLDAAHVLWAEQTGDRPTGLIAELRSGPLSVVGTGDELDHEFDGARPAGQELEMQVLGLREFALQIQCYAPKATLGDASGFALAVRCQTALGLPSVRDALFDAGLAPFDVQPAQNVTALLNNRFEGRGLLTVRFYLSDNASELTTYIESVELNSYMGPPDLGTKAAIDI